MVHTMSCVLATYRYKLMLSCWCSEPQARLNFTQLKYSFKSMIFAANTDNNSYVTVQPTPCCAPAIVDIPLSSSSLRVSEEPSYERLSTADLQCQPNPPPQKCNVWYLHTLQWTLEPPWPTFPCFLIHTLGARRVNLIYIIAVIAAFGTFCSHQCHTY